MPVRVLAHFLTGFARSWLPAHGRSGQAADAAAAQNQGLSIALEGASANDQGVWECTPGKFERQIESAEVMHILTGSATFTPVGGESVSFDAGDTVFFPKNTFVVGKIKETMRKVYVIFSGVQEA